MPFFGESEKQKKIRERADTAAEKARTQYPDLPQEEAGLRDQSLNPREMVTEAAAEVLGETGSIVQAGLAAMRPKSVLSRMKSKMPNRTAKEARQAKDTGRLPKNPYRDPDKPKPTTKEGPPIDYSINKPRGFDPNETTTRYNK